MYVVGQLNGWEPQSGQDVVAIEHKDKCRDMGNLSGENLHELIEANEEIAWNRVKADQRLQGVLGYVAKPLGVRGMLNLSSQWKTYFLHRNIARHLDSAGFRPAAPVHAFFTGLRNTEAKERQDRKVSSNLVSCCKPNRFWNNCHSVL